MISVYIKKYKLFKLFYKYSLQAYHLFFLISLVNIITINQLPYAHIKHLVISQWNELRKLYLSFINLLCAYLTKVLLTSFHIFEHDM